MKTAVVLFNLGGPDKIKSVQPFLFNLFNDKKIINLPNPLRFLLAKLISSRRNKEATEIYEQIGGKSPILETTMRQADELEKWLNNNTPHENKVFVCMRYWHPMTKAAVQSVKNYDPDNIFLLPLYPQYSTATTESSLEEWYKQSKKSKLIKTTRHICCYPSNRVFLESHIELIEKKIKGLKNYRILFSAHGLPEITIKRGDPYQWQVEKTVDGIVQLMNEKNYTICYQSRVGPLKWIGPSTTEAIDKAISDNVEIVIVPIAFVSDHSETLVELDIEYREYALQKNFEKYHVVPALNINKTFISSLGNIVKQGLGCESEGNVINRICPIHFKKCKNNNAL